MVNAPTFPGFAAVAFLVSRFIRELASGADASRKRVVELEQDRSRAFIHDLLVCLRLDRFAQVDDETRAVMIAQAQAQARADALVFRRDRRRAGPAGAG